jgi:Ca2+-binding RTX toxin-like protein
LSSDVQFIVEEDGRRYIENLKIVPHNMSENFDMETRDYPTEVANGLLLSPRIDPGSIGERVNIVFSGDREPVRYDNEDYENDVENHDDGNLLRPVSLYSEITALTDRMFENGTIRYLDENKPNMFGTNDDDRMSGTIRPDTEGPSGEVDFDDHRYLGDYVSNGIHYMAGDGSDVVNATEHNDVLEGGEGVDRLYGRLGDDELHGGPGNDTGGNGGLFGDHGDDALYGDAGHDTLEGGADRDLLVGGVGRDTLRGGAGIDILYGDNRYYDADSDQYVLVNDREIDRSEGGQGDDLYFAGSGDVINDADGLGMVSAIVTI